MSDSEPARKKARKQVSFREDVEESPGRHRVNGNMGNAAGSGSKNNSYLPQKLMDALDEVRMKETSLAADDLMDEDNEFWVLQCPTNVDPITFLVGNKLRLEGETEVENEETSKKYEIVAVPKKDEKASFVALLPSADGTPKLVGTPVSGHLMIREQIEEIEIPKLAPEPRPPHRIPQGIKERHPIYGPNFEEIIRANQKNLKSKKKRSKKVDDEIETVSESTVSAERRKSKKSHASEPATEIEPETPKSKRKSYQINGSIPPIHEEPETPAVHKKKKKSKRHLEDAEAPETYTNGYANGRVSDEQDIIQVNGKVKREK